MMPGQPPNWFAVDASRSDFYVSHPACARPRFRAIRRAARQSPEQRFLSFRQHEDATSPQRAGRERRPRQVKATAPFVRCRWKVFSKDNVEMNSDNWLAPACHAVVRSVGRNDALHLEGMEGVKKMRISDMTNSVGYTFCHQAFGGGCGLGGAGMLRRVVVIFTLLAGSMLHEENDC